MNICLNFIEQLALVYYFVDKFEPFQAYVCVLFYMGCILRHIISGFSMTFQCRLLDFFVFLSTYHLQSRLFVMSTTKCLKVAQLKSMLFVFVAFRPNKQLWSCWDGQFT